MDGPVDGTNIILRFKPKLMDALKEDPDLLILHCHSLGILSNNEYNNIKDLNIRSRQVRDILDYVICDNKRALSFLRLLRRQDMQETFPDLKFLQTVQIKKRKTQKTTETTAKRKLEMLENEQSCITNSRMVTEREMMKVARYIGKNWREVGIMALDMSTTTLQQIEEDNKLHIERVFAMLRRWSIRERDRATAAHLYSLLTQEENCIDPRNISILLENS